MLRVSDGLDEEQTEELREAFMFLFSLQEDYEAFSKEMMDTSQMQLFSASDRK